MHELEKRFFRLSSRSSQSSLQSPEAGAKIANNHHCDVVEDCNNNRE